MAGASSTGAGDELNRQLRDAFWRNDVAGAHRLIAAGADVNALDGSTQSAYLIATSEGYLDLLRLALANGADVDAKDSWNGTGLIRAAERGHWMVVGELLRAGIDRDHVNRIGYQAIHEAVWLGEGTADHLTTVRVLVAGGASVNQRSGTERLTPRELADRRGRASIARALEAMDRAPTAADSRHTDVMDNPDVALLAAAGAGDADAVAVALRLGADIEARDDYRRTALLLAATADHVEVARVLVALGADPNALDDRHDTPWLVTGVTGSVAMLETLLPAHPDLTIVNRFGGVSLIPAAERGHVDYVRRVLATDIDVNHVNDLGWTALLEAVILGDGGPAHQQIVQLLLAAGADPRIADSDGRTALDHARRRGQAVIVSLLSG